jgi:FKBP-type peptidyl-prolyl cis-trans isomerase FkpA
MKKLLFFPSVLMLVSALLLAPACKKNASPTGSTGPGNTLAGGLVVQEVQAGSGAEAVAGKNVSVHYTGRLTDGTKFDSSYDRGQPIDFRLGSGMVIKGWDMGIQGMKVGGKRKLTIPPELAYGARGTPGGPIPPNATLVFDVELTGVQ